nr:T9SS type A sorting domain-containing protein [Bacteroidota bacterium]
MKKTHILLLSFLLLSCSVFSQDYYYTAAKKGYAFGGSDNYRGLMTTKVSSVRTNTPANVMMKLDFTEGYTPEASIEWDLDTTGIIDHYEVYMDGLEVYDPYGSIAYGYCVFSVFTGLLEPLELDVYHDAGVVAVDTNGLSSDTVTFHFYFSWTSYMRPVGLNVLNDLDAGTALFTWDEPPFGGGPEEPSVTGFSVYLDGSFVAETSEPQYTFTGLSTGSNYVAGLVTHYSDEYNDSTFYPNYAKTEFYFDELTAPVNLAVDESSGIFSWSKPNMDGDVIGGTFVSYPVSVMWEMVWFVEGEQWTTFGNETSFVKTRWGINAWLHNVPHQDDMEAIWFEGMGPGFSYAEAGDSNRHISEISNVSGLEWDINQSTEDADTHEGIGEFIVHHNEEIGYYGVARLDDFFLTDIENLLWGLDLTWWVQTNGSDDFSDAYNYYPNYYIIYLDGEITDTLTPGYEQQFDNDYQYQFNGLVAGQSYTAGIVAVYNVGKSEMITMDFSPTVGIDENCKVSSLLGIYPNPVSSHAGISYAVNEAGPVSIEVFDVMGKKVKTLLN